MIDHFSSIPDPRVERKHKLIDIITLCGVISGADGWVVAIVRKGEGSLADGNIRIRKWYPITRYIWKCVWNDKYRAI